MQPHSLNVAYSDNDSQILWEDGERIFRRGWRLDDDGQRRGVLIVLPTADHPSRTGLDRHTHEYELKDQLDAAWAVRPLDLVHDAGRTVLVLEDVNGEPLDKLLGSPMEMGRFLSLAIGITAAVGKLHQRGLVHKDIKPANVVANGTAGAVWLTGFGIASRLVRERQTPHPPETIAGTLAYMAPEQTGRMNRSIDSRSDLYALGVTFYQMLTGALPFTASDPMEWVHCHLARRPVAPAERLKEIPGVISAIVMKLLAKMAEDRYQTAAGLEHDLRHCQSEWNAKRQVDDFQLGERDTPDRLVIPEILYGRRNEVETLLAAFDRVVQGGVPELVLVSGYSGIGKSSVVNELQPRALFASGKFDQYKRDVPYSTLAQAFQSLVRPLLAKNDAELGAWREALREALGPNGQLLVDLVPELKLIIGEQSSVPELPPQDAQRRFQLVFRRFLAVFARPEHPLALFLDDLQWLDAATIDLLGELLIHPDVRHVLLIGAYRANEVTPAHPLMRKLETIRASGRVQDINLGALTTEDLGGLVADTLCIDAEQAAPLAELIHVKTDGNPFFVIQFLHALADEGLVVFDHEQARWSWDLSSIHAKRYTDNVVELLAEKLTRLPLDTQDALRRLACLGNAADVAILSLVLGTPEQQVHATLWEALRQQFIERLAGSYSFVHDRMQEAVYALIPEKARAEAHLTIGRLMLAQTPPEKRDEAIFEIVNQLNRGAPLITARDEREQLAELNLAAGKRAKASSAYASALTYLTAGAARLPEDAWERRQELAFELELHRTDCEVYAGGLQGAEQRLLALATRSVGTIQRCAVAHRRLDLYVALGEGERAVAVALECLRHAGIDWSAHPTEADARREYERIWSLLGDRTIEDLVDLPLIQDPEARATLDVLTSLVLPALYTDMNLYTLSVCMAVNLSLMHGNSEASPVNYVATAMIAGPRFGHYDEGYRFGRMACDLLERRGLTQFGPRTYVGFAIMVPWSRPLREAIEPSRRAFQMAKEHGDPTFAALASRGLSTILLALGHPLDQFEPEAQDALEFVQRYGFFLDRLSAPIALARTLRGRNTKFGSLDDGEFAERSFEERIAGQPSRAFLECYYWIRKLQARFFAGDYLSAIEAADRVEKWYAISPALSLFPLEKAESHFYCGLCRAARCEPLGPDPYAEHREALNAHEQHLRALAANCPQNFEDRAALVGAEIARLEGRELDAERLYEAAIKSARASESVHNEGLANELAARFYTARDFKMIANAYLREARSCYLRWGADGKVRQLEQLHPWLRHEERAPGPTGTIEAPVEQLDLATVIEVSQALSGEVVLERLIDRLMHAAIKHAGADRALLICPRSDELLIYAEASAHGGDVAIHVQQRDASGVGTLPESLVRYILRTGETVVLDDASSQNSFSADPYIVQRRARSILCLPMINQGRLAGILYFENNLAPQVFTPDRLTVLKVLATQGAISLENIGLYRALADREAKVRRLIDANIIGTFIWKVADLHSDARANDVLIVEANDAFLNMVGYDRADIAAGLLSRSALSLPEWRDRDASTMEEVKKTGTVQPFEKEYLRKDGSRVPVLLGFAAFDDRRIEGYAFVLDLTERKRAEEALRESERNARLIVDGIPGLVGILDPNGDIEAVNRQILEYYGKTLEELKKHWPDLVHPEDLPRVIEVLTQSIASGEPFEVEFRARRFDGVYRWLQNRGDPLRDAKGRIVRWYNLLVDIDERKRAEDALRESEERFRDYAETASDWLWEMGPDHKLTMLTGNAFGSSPSARLGTAAWERALDLETEPEKWRAIRAAMDSRKPFRDFVYLAAGGDGPPMYVKASGKPVFDSNGEFRGYRGTGTDATGIIRAEQALRESERRLRSAIDGIPGLVGVLGPNGDVEAVNRQILEYCGQSLEELKNWGTNGTVHPEDLPHVAEVFTRSIAAGIPYQIEQRLRRFDGEYRWFDNRGVPVREDSGRIVRWYVLLTDIDDRTQAVARLQQMQSDFTHINRVSTMGELAASLSHEILHPIATARNNARAGMRFLEMTPPNLNEAREALGCVVRDADRAKDIVGRVRAHIKKAPPRRESFDLNEAVREALAMARSAIARNRIAVNANLMNEMIPVQGDRVQLQQVVVNLILNAVEAMGSEEKGELSIRIEQGRADGVVVQVRDSGPGIDPANVERVFEPFYTTKVSGVGMGLSICRSIINGHGGRLWAEANEPRGAVFQFTLPSSQEGT